MCEYKNVITEEQNHGLVVHWNNRTMESYSNTVLYILDDVEHPPTPADKEFAGSLCGHVPELGGILGLGTPGTLEPDSGILPIGQGEEKSLAKTLAAPPQGWGISIWVAEHVAWKGLDWLSLRRNVGG